MGCYLTYGEDNCLWKAFQYFINSAKQGNKDAQRQLEKCYVDGIGVDKNKELGKKWLVLSKSSDFYGNELRALFNKN